MKGVQLFSKAKLFSLEMLCSHQILWDAVVKWKESGKNNNILAITKMCMDLFHSKIDWFIKCLHVFVRQSTPRSRLILLWSSKHGQGHYTDVEPNSAKVEHSESPLFVSGRGRNVRSHSLTETSRISKHLTWLHLALGSPALSDQGSVSFQSFTTGKNSTCATSQRVDVSDSWKLNLVDFCLKSQRLESTSVCFFPLELQLSLCIP